MRAARRLLCIILIAAVAFASGGCWDYNETEDLLFVMGMSLDRAGSGRLRCVIEYSTVRSQGLAPSPEYIEVEGDTFHDAMFNADKISERPMNYSHMLAVVVSQDVARKDMADLVDMLLRMPMVRDTLTIFVSKQATAQEVMEAKNPAEDINSFDMVGSLKAERQLEKAPDIKLYEFADAMGDLGQSAVLPAVGLADTGRGKIVEVSGMAVFRGPWMQGFLDEIDTRAFMVTDFDRNVLNMPLPADPGGKFTSASIVFYAKKVDIVPDYEDGKASVDIYIRGEIDILEISGASTDTEKFKTVTDAVLAAASTEMENSVTNMLRDTQQMSGCDVLSIGHRLRRVKPDAWREMSGRWREVYDGMDIRVRAGLTLRSTGHEAEPLTKGN